VRGSEGMEILIKNLSKTYSNAKKKAISNINLEITSNKIIGLVGPNGAGKTTLIKCIVGILSYEEGEIIFSPAEIKESIGYIPEKFELPGFLRGIDFLKFVSVMKEVEFLETKKMLEEIGKDLAIPPLDMFVEEYSKGQKEKLLFLSILIGSPKLLVLDEPFTGIDILSVEFLKEYLRRLKSSERIIIISSHISDLVADLCDEILIINNGILYEKLSFTEDISLESKINVLRNTLKNLSLA
jgi:ABC-2 type transport system ATP-binding protein